MEPFHVRVVDAGNGIARRKTTQTATFQTMTRKATVEDCREDRRAMTERTFTVPRGEHVDTELAERLEQFANEYWLPVHVTEQQAKKNDLGRVQAGVTWTVGNVNGQVRLNWPTIRPTACSWL